MENHNLIIEIKKLMLAIYFNWNWFFKHRLWSTRPVQVYYLQSSEAVVQRSSVRKVFCRPDTLLKERPWHRCFSVNFVKFLKIPILQNTFGGCFWVMSALNARCPCSEFYTLVTTVINHWNFMILNNLEGRTIKVTDTWNIYLPQNSTISSSFYLFWQILLNAKQVQKGGDTHKLQVWLPS